MIAVGVFLALLALGLLVSWFGADSRDGRDWQPRTWIEHVPPRTPTGLHATDEPAERRADR